MAQLTFTGRSRDGKRLLLVDEAGQEHSLVIDARLRRDGALLETPLKLFPADECTSPGRNAIAVDGIEERYVLLVGHRPLNDRCEPADVFLQRRKVLGTTLDRKNPHEWIPLVDAFREAADVCAHVDDDRPRHRELVDAVRIVLRDV